jgi:hypothetical protein
MARTVPPSSTRDTNPGPARTALGVFAAGFTVVVNIVDPLATSARGTAESLSGRRLREFFVPRSLEGLVKEFINMLEGNSVRCAASWWQLLRVTQGALEARFQASITHAVTALELDCFSRWKLVAAGNARNSRHGDHQGSYQRTETR